MAITMNRITNINKSSLLRIMEAERPHVEKLAEDIRREPCKLCGGCLGCIAWFEQICDECKDGAEIEASLRAAKFENIKLRAALGEISRNSPESNQQNADVIVIRALAP